MKNEKNEKAKITRPTLKMIRKQNENITMYEMNYFQTPALNAIVLFFKKEKKKSLY